jgi:hypothetical protein
MEKNQLLTTVKLSAPLLAQVGTTTNRVDSVPIQAVYHHDRIAAEEAGNGNMDEQSDFLISRMTNLPLSALLLLSLADYDVLAEQYSIMMDLIDDDAPKTLEAGHVHTLYEPIQAGSGELTQVTLRELTRGDQRSANNFSKKITERNACLIARMCNVQVEDVYLMHARDTYFLESCFRLVVPAGRAPAQGGYGVDESAPQPVTS